MAQPYYSGDELIARGVKMTCQSVEDGGKGLSYNVYLFNVTPGAEINYRNGVVTTSEQAAQVNGFINTAMSTFVQPKPVGDVTYIYASNDGYSTGRGGKIDVSDITVNVTFKDTLKLDAGLFSSEIDMNKLINNDRFQNAIAEAIFSRADFASKINDARNENIYGSKLRNSAWLAGTEAHNTFGRKNGYGN